VQTLMDAMEVVLWFAGRDEQIPRFRGLMVEACESVAQSAAARALEFDPPTFDYQRPAQ
jgi:hypothetical protein